LAAALAHLDVGRRVHLRYMRTSNSMAAFLLACGSAVAASVADIPAPFATNVPGQHLLQRPWVGEAKATVRTGYYATNQSPPELRKLETEIHFDLLTVPGGASSNSVRALFLSQSRGRTREGWSYVHPHTYRRTLPSDNEITGCRTVSDLTSLVGVPQWADGAPYTAGWRFFTIGPSNRIETLVVICTAFGWEGGKGPPDSLAVWRGTAYETR
jgi:hypothetical protein